MKAIFLLAVIVAVVTTVFAQNHTVSWGFRGPRDRLLRRDIAFKKSNLWFKVEGDYEWNQKGIPYPSFITQVLAIDQYRNGEGGYATLTSGGPHYTEVKLHFRSQRFHGYNFIIEIYGV